MKFGLIAQGSNGDVEILLAIALGLVQKGHRVDMFIISFNDRDYTAYGDIAGLQIYQKHIYDSYRNSFEDFEFWNEPVEVRKGFYFKIHETFKDDIETYGTQFCEQCDCVISLAHIFEVACLAEKFSTPYISVNFPFWHIRSSYEKPNTLAHMDEEVEHLWDVFESLENVCLKRTINKFRRSHDLPPVKSVIHEVKTSPLLNIIPYATIFKDQKPDLKPCYKLSGYLKNSYGQSDWVLPQHLSDFIGGEEKPVFMTVGSMIENENDIDYINTLLLQAAKQSGHKTIILSKWGDDANTITEDVYKLGGFISYPAVLKHCSLVVHHGGIGIMHHTLEAGCPAVVIKYGHDQFYNAKLLFNRGLSSGSIDRKELSASALAELIEAGLRDDTLIQKSSAAGALLRAEDGVQNAVAAIESVLKQVAV